MSMDTQEKKPGERPERKPERPAARKGAGVSQRRRQRPQISLTARGGVALLVAVTFAGALLEFSIVPGAAFVLVCVVTALATRPPDLPVVVVAPPVVYLAGTLLAEIVHALSGRSFVQSLLVALPLDLAVRTPWLIAGTLAAVVIAVRRGLLRAWRELTLQADGFRLTRERQTEEDPVRWDERP